MRIWNALFNKLCAISLASTVSSNAPSNRWCPANRPTSCANHNTGRSSSQCRRVTLPPKAELLNASPDYAPKAEIVSLPGAKQPLYAAWIEWFPFNIFQIKNFPVGPGEEIFCQVWNTSPTVGHAFFVDFSRNSSLKVAFSAPQNVRLVGNCAEWIVERPSSSSGLSTLTNYVACPWDNCVAVGSVGAKYNAVYFPATTNAQVFSLTMLDDAGNGISRANLQGLYDLWFRNFGSSR